MKNNMDKTQKKINVKLSKLASSIVISLFIFLMLGCSPEEDHIPVSNNNFCSSVDEEAPVALSEYLSPFENKMKNSTGVYIFRARH